jgi:hypothetical protein
VLTGAVALGAFAVGLVELNGGGGVGLAVFGGAAAQKNALSALEAGYGLGPIVVRRR